MEMLKYWIIWGDKKPPSFTVGAGMPAGFWATFVLSNLHKFPELTVN